MKKIIQKNEKICHESWISIGRFCFRVDIAEKALEKMGFSQHLTTAVISTGGWRDETCPRNGQNPKPRKNQFGGANPAVRVHAVLAAICLLEPARICYTLP
jgi:hypothetical protein